jgi:hypothetical protein
VQRRAWVPLLDGTERLGVVEYVLPPGDDVVDTGRSSRSRTWSPSWS